MQPQVTLGLGCAPSSSLISAKSVTGRVIIKIESTTNKCPLLPSLSLILAAASPLVQQRPSSKAPPSLGTVLVVCYWGSVFYKVLFNHIRNAGVKMRTEPVTDTTRNNHRKIRSRTWATNFQSCTTCLMKCSFLTCLEMYRMESAAFSRKAITIFSPSFACLYFCFPRNFDFEVVPFSSVSENE